MQRIKNAVPEIGFVSLLTVLLLGALCLSVPFLIAVLIGLLILSPFVPRAVDFIYGFDDY